MYCCCSGCARCCSVPAAARVIVRAASDTALEPEAPAPAAPEPCGYELYQKSLLGVPWPSDYGDASSDDLSSEWDSDAAEPPSTSAPATPVKVLFKPPIISKTLFVLIGVCLCFSAVRLA